MSFVVYHYYLSGGIGDIPAEGHYMQIHHVIDGGRFSFQSVGNFFRFLDNQICNLCLQEEEASSFRFLFGVSHLGRIISRRYGFSVQDIPDEIRCRLSVAQLLSSSAERNRYYQKIAQQHNHPFGHLHKILAIDRFLSHFSSKDIVLYYKSGEFYRKKIDDTR